MTSLSGTAPCAFANTANMSMMKKMDAIHDQVSINCILCVVSLRAARFQTPFNSAASFKNMRILLVEDHVELSRWLAKALHDAPLTVECALTGTDADALLHTQEYGLVILDLSLPKMDGLDVLKRMRVRGCKL